MNQDVLEFSNAIAAGAVGSVDVAVRATERIQSWICRSYRFHGPLMQRALNLALGGFRSSALTPENLEQTLPLLWSELATGGLPFRIFVPGKPRALKPGIQEQIYLIGREALVNALRHSKASSIEAEIEYLPRRLRVMVRDNGCGMDSEVIRSGEDGRWGLMGMRERAGSIGARLRIWSKPGCGTEVEICVSGEIAETCA